VACPDLTALSSRWLRFTISIALDVQTIRNRPLSRGCDLRPRRVR
jgi:hypothetical protein